jgi:hypothetical protein
VLRTGTVSRLQHRFPAGIQRDHRRIVIRHPVGVDPGHVFAGFLFPFPADEFQFFRHGNFLLFFGNLLTYKILVFSRIANILSVKFRKTSKKSIKEREQNTNQFSSLISLSSIARRAEEDHLSYLKGKTARFTLIELLVVIAIIGIR